MPLWTEVSSGNGIITAIRRDTPWIDANWIEAGDQDAKRMAAALKDSLSVLGLSLNGNKIGDAGCVALAKSLETNQTLQNLDLGRNNIGDEGGVALAKTLETNQTLTVLGLMRNNIRHDGSVALAKALETNQTLTYLGLSSNCTGDEGGVALAKALQTNQTLQTLRLTGDKIGEKGGVALARALETNQTLQELGLSSNQMGDNGGVALAKALQTNQTLTALHLRINQIGDEGGVALAKALQTNQTLQELGLSSNQIGDNGGVALAKALETNQTLTALHLRNNQIGDDGGVALGKALETNQALQKLEIGDNRIPTDVTSDIEAKIKRNQLASEINQGRKVRFNRVKVAVLGHGAAGKSSTVRSLAGKAHIEAHLSTEGWDNSKMWVDRQDLDGDWDQGDLGLDRIVSGVLADPNLPTKEETLAEEVEDAKTNDEEEHEHEKPVEKGIWKALASLLVSKWRVRDMALRLVSGKMSGTAEVASHEQEWNSYVFEEVPLSWVWLVDHLGEKPDRPWLPLQEVEELGRQAKLDGVETALTFFHELGVLIHLKNTENLRGKVVTDPQWMADMVTKVLRVEIHRSTDGWRTVMQRVRTAELVKDYERLFGMSISRDGLEEVAPRASLKQLLGGEATRDLLESLWDADSIEFLIDLMEEMFLMCDRDGAREHFLVPSLLPFVTMPKWNKILCGFSDEAPTFRLTFSFLPEGVFQRFLTGFERSFKQADGDIKTRFVEVFNNCAVLLLNGARTYLRSTQSQEGEIFVRINTSLPKIVAQVLRTIVAIFRFTDQVFSKSQLAPQLQLRASGREDYVDYEEAYETRKFGDANEGEVMVIGSGRQTVPVGSLATFFHPLVAPALSASDEATEFDLFISFDRESAEQRVAEIVHELASRGFRVFQATPDRDGVTAEMARGIKASKVGIVFMTEAYIAKVNRGDRNEIRQQFQSITQTRPFVPVCLEAAVANPATWREGLFGFLYMDELYVDMTAATSEETVDLLEVKIRRKMRRVVPVARRKKIFASYCWARDSQGRDNKTRVVRVVQGLRDLGHSVWQDVVDLDADAQQGMAEGIERCKLALVFASGAYLDRVGLGRGNIAREFRGISTSRPFVVIKMDDVNVSSLVGQLEPVDVIDMANDGTFEDAVVQLDDVIDTSI
ncbi:Protein NLRC3 [Durusdinium trenchii]|uniref:Protein NLRC3 n=1 Tax=Durusdinium trenchii TaxID=1381693 RepID=A0ABP0J442_9DINO